MNPRMTDHTGKKYGMLTILKYVRSVKKDTIWLVRCECGNTKEMRASTFKKPRNKGCGCLRHRKQSEHPNWSGYKGLGSSFYGNIKKKAIHRNIEFDVSIEYLWDLFSGQEKRCALSGIPLTIETPNNYWNSGNASLDRINSSVGYIKGNVQWVCKDANFMKQQLSESHFVEMCRLIVETQDEKILNFKCAEYF